MKSVHRAWDKLSRALSLPSRSTSHNTRAYTDFNIVSPPMEELLLVENDIVVGATGTFDGWNGNIQLSSKELLPSGFVPEFETREEQLDQLRKAVCQLSVQVPGSGSDILYGSATAFFIGPTILLTAGHVLSTGTLARAQYPGKLKVQRDFRAVLKKEIPASAFDVKAIANYTSSGIDFGVLKTKDFSHDHWIPVDLSGIINEEEVIDILGYPGFINGDQLLVSHRSITDSNVDQAVRNASLLLPSGILTVTCGTVIESGLLPTFAASTTHGMSGSPVIRNGKAIGVHVGSNKLGKNHFVRIERGMKMAEKVIQCKGTFGYE